MQCDRTEADTQYWRTVGAEASRRHVDSSDDDDDDADWLRPNLSASRGSDDEDEFGVSARRV